LDKVMLASEFAILQDKKKKWGLKTQQHIVMII